jgi:hypothetical protein
MREQPLITVLLRLPIFYNPSPQGRREPVEDEKFLQTAEEIAEQLGGGTLFVFRQEKHAIGSVAMRAVSYWSGSDRRQST